MTDIRSTSVPTIHSTSVSAPLTWISGAFSLMIPQIVGFILMSAVYLALVFVLGLIPFLGQIATFFLAPLLMAGFFLAVRKARAGEKVAVGDLFAFFSHERRGALLLLALAPLALLVAMMILSLIVGAGSLGVGALVGNENTVGAVGGLALIFVVLGLVLSFFAYFAFLFAIPLVAFEGYDVVPALQAGFTGTLKNIVSLFFFGVLSTIIGTLGLLVFVVGLMIAAPLLLIALYLGYEEIFPTSSEVPKEA